jgi:hypothetical protein
MQQRHLVQTHRPAHFKSRADNNRKRLRTVYALLALAVCAVVLNRF